MKNKPYIFIFILVLFNSILLSQERLHILNYDLKNYPSINAGYFVFDSNGMPDFSNQGSDFKVFDNGVEVPVLYQNCLNINPSIGADVCISVDLSLKNFPQDRQIDRAKLFLTELFKYINSYNIKASLQSYDYTSYMNSDFESDFAVLSNAVNTLRFSTGSIVDSGFLAYNLGAFEILKFRSASTLPKAIIWLVANESKFDIQRVANEAKNNNVKIFPIYFGNSIPDSIYYLAQETGAYPLLIDNRIIDYTPIALSLLSLCKNYSPCDLTWRNNLDCFDVHNLRIEIPSRNLVNEFAFNIPSDIKPKLLNNPEFLRFSSVIPGTSKSLNLSFTAKNGNILIDSLIITNPLFSIDSGNIITPTLLPKDSSKTIKITFSPIDSAIVFDSLQIISNACEGSTVLITGGYPNTPPNERTLTLLTPNCGDRLLVGDTANVSWTGLLPADVIQLQYSTDGGDTWDTLATDITGLDYYWEVPDKESDSCLVRVIQLWPNNIGQTMVLQHSGGVNCANFNRDGSLVITSSKDRKNLVRIWNANNGQLINELSGHSKPINWVSFDPKDRYAVSAGDDSTAIIWDLKKSEAVRTLVEHKDVIRTANFSPSGDYIITSSNDGRAIVWNTETGTIVNSDYQTGAPLWHACFSPDEKYVLITDNSGKIIAFDINDVSNRKIFDMQNGVVPYATFSKDMKKLAAANWFGKVTVWDFENESELFTITHDSTKIIPINSCDFNDTGMLLLTAGVDTVPRLWDGNTGASIATLLNEHTSSVQMATFNFDATRILTASWDSTAKVWNREQIGLQVDTSDCFFSITRLQTTIKDIAFDDTEVGTFADSLVSAFITNLLEFPIDVLSYVITGVNSQDFEIINYIPPYIIEGLDNSHILIRFKPTAVGPRNANLNIQFRGASKQINLSGNGVNHGLFVNPAFIDFGQVFIGDNKDTTLNEILKNISSSTITIDSLQKAGPDYYHFNFIPDNAFSSIQAGRALPMHFRFTPEKTGRLSAVFQLFYNGLGTPKNITLFGEGINPRIDTASIIIGSASGSPGDIVNIPVRISSLSSAGIATSIKGFRITLEFNSTLLEPVDYVTDDITLNGNRAIGIILPTEFDSDSVLKFLQFRVGLGNDTVTNLNITEISLIGEGKMHIHVQNGLFSLTEICESGGLRLIETEGKLYLANNKPNPVEGITEIEFGIIEDGFTELFLVDVMGNRVYTAVSQFLNNGRYTSAINSSLLPSGKLFYVLRTNTAVIVKSMYIIK